MPLAVKFVDRDAAFAACDVAFPQSVPSAKCEAEDESRHAAACIDERSAMGGLCQQIESVEFGEFSRTNGRGFFPKSLSQLQACVLQVSGIDIVIAVGEEIHPG